ncbi:MAG: co-chaperone DjlA, partial [Gammaproteobacteria bacterium]
ATFSVMGHLCKADGLVSKDEIRVASEVMGQMDLNPAQREAAMALFNEGKKSGFPLDDVLIQLRKEIGHRLTLKRMFIEIQCLAACADDSVHSAEKKLLHHICDVLGFSRYELESLLVAIETRYHHTHSQTGKPGGLVDACKVLGIQPGATEAEVKKAYRRLISQHHPDKLVSKGLPEEMMKLAAQRTHEIRQAYETIREQKGW